MRSRLKCQEFLLFWGKVFGSLYFIIIILLIHNHSTQRHLNGSYWEVICKLSTHGKDFLQHNKRRILYFSNCHGKSFYSLSCLFFHSSHCLSATKYLLSLQAIYSPNISCNYASYASHISCFLIVTRPSFFTFTLTRPCPLLSLSHSRSFFFSVSAGCSGGDLPAFAGDPRPHEQRRGANGRQLPWPAWWWPVRTDWRQPARTVGRESAGFVGDQPARNAELQPPDHVAVCPRGAQRLTRPPGHQRTQQSWIFPFSTHVSRGKEIATTV